MKRISVYVESEQANQLRELAGEESRAMTALVREALEDYLTRRRSGARRVVGPRRQIPEYEWRSRFAAALADIRAGISPGTAGADLEDAITAARAEVRQARRKPR
ncbi:MAG TPA: ribbon-helix-helix protein, CopG family [Chloroflexota bacterium]|nr:ribbon-helix-helix protein, CopG family [Chloroflexota bacterium]